MSTRIASETIVKHVPVRVRADFGANKQPIVGCSDQAAHNVVIEIVKIGLTSGEEVGSRLPEKVLHAIRNKPSCDYGQGQAQQTHV
jgi:hypothetical protein